MDKVILYYTDNQLEEGVAAACREQLKKAASEIPIVNVCQAKIGFGSIEQIIDVLPKSRQSMFGQILIGLYATLRTYNPKYIQMVEHDILYPEGWFDFIPPKDNVFYYNLNKVFMDKKGFYPDLKFPCLSTLCCNFKLLLAHIHLRLYRIHQMNKPKGGWTNSEPGISEGDTSGYYGLAQYCDAPAIDIRHGNNLSKVDFGDHKESLFIKGWNPDSDVTPHLAISRKLKWI